MRRRNWLLAAVVFTGGCGGLHAGDGEDARGRGPALTPLPALALHEPDSAPIGNLTFLSRAPDGEFFITDLDRGRVLRFAPDGQLVGTLGRPGTGPGEFRLPAVTGVVADSLLAVSDVSLRRLSLFRLSTGAFFRTVPLPVQDIGHTWTAQGDTVVLAAHLAPALVLRWQLGSDSITTLGTTPGRLLKALPVTIRHGRSDVIPTASGYLAQLPTEPGLHLLDRSGRLTGFVRIPWHDRRGEPDDLVEQQTRRLDQGGPTAYQPVGSLTAGLQRLPNGQIEAVHLDVDMGPGGSPLDFVNYRYYVSLISPDLDRACVDALAPLPGDLISLPAFQGDSIFFFVRTVGDDDRVRSELRGFEVSDRGCRWEPTGGVAAPRP